MIRTWQDAGEWERGQAPRIAKATLRMASVATSRQLISPKPLALRSMTPLRLFLLLLLAPVWATTIEEGLAHLEKNKNVEGVVVLPSGLQYKILKKGSGTHHPTVDSPCLCHYEGTLISGEVFDSSYARGDPTTFAPNQVIAGWTEAMQVRNTHVSFVHVL
jgi:Domain amino terminal to FKBP-type peptidyl-prolyl isomerase/FKBP-type peptidyl-prolyl cis-trans isomerase